MPSALPLLSGAREAEVVGEEHVAIRGLIEGEVDSIYSSRRPDAIATTPIKTTSQIVPCTMVCDSSSSCSTWIVVDRTWGWWPLVTATRLGVEISEISVDVDRSMNSSLGLVSTALGVRPI